jgi:histone-lysine N-methyltransferase SETMAR
MIVTIVWNPHGFYLIDALPKVQTFNEICYVNIILRSILEDRSSGPGAGLMIHADNTKPHTARKILNFFRENHLGIALHPPYSPDLQPSDSFLFGHVKHVLEGAEFPWEEVLLAPIQPVLSHLTSDTLRAVFTKWVEWLNWIVLNEGRYYREPKQWQT